MAFKLRIASRVVRLGLVFAVGAVMAAGVAVTSAQSPARSAHATRLAERPPMGWNSWDAYGLTINEEQFRANVDVLVKELKPFGWNYAVVDEGWFLPHPEDLHASGKHAEFALDANGRYIPVPARFPSAMKGEENIGFRALGNDVHALGLQFGIHIVRGIPKEAVTKNTAIAGSRFHAEDAADKSDACPWDPTNWGVRDTPAGQAWYDSVIQQYAGWGVDYLKVDCVSDHPWKLAEIRMIHRAIAKVGRPMVLSLSPGPTSEGHAAVLAQYAQLWRISDDVWDYWRANNSSIYEQFQLVAGWVPFARPGSWPDADMLPLGYLGPKPGEGVARQTRLTHAEQQTLMTLWAMGRSPLILGANLTKLDPWTLALLTNRDVLEVDQFGHDQMQQSREYDMIGWTSHGPGNVTYLALFNVGDRERTLDRLFTFYDIPKGEYQVKDLWAQQDMGSVDAVKVTLAPHSSVLYRLTPVSTSR